METAFTNKTHFTHPTKIILGALIAAFLLAANIGYAKSDLNGQKANSGSIKGGLQSEISKTGSQQKNQFDAHESLVNYHFKDSDMDFTFGSMVLGSVVNHGSEIGEVFFTASKIKDGDAASWQQEWIKIARLAEARGEKSLAAGHKVSARDQFQRASNYHRFGLLAMMPDDNRLPKIAEKSRSLLKKVGSLLNPPMEYIEIPFEDTVLPGYFRKANNDQKPTKTLLVIGGGETFAEDLFFYLAPQAFDRGYIFMTVDLPGQGLLPLKKKYFRPDMDLPIKAAIDYALTRPDVDAEKIALYGYSGGGGFVPQTAMNDHRVKAIAMNSCVVDAESLFATMPVVKATPKEINSWSSFHRNTAKLVAWSWGVPMDKLSALVKANQGFSFDPSKVTIPALIIVGEGEFKSAEVKRQQKLCFNNLPNPKKRLVVTPENEGATNHCIMENRSLAGQVVFDWLDGIFVESK